MGRKNKSKKTNQAGKSSPPETKELSKQAKRDVMDHVKSLLDKCSQPGNTGPKELDDYMEIRDLIEKIQTLQKDITLQPFNREGNFASFKDWLNSSDVDTSTVEISDFQDCGYGLKAVKSLKEAELFLSIPRKVMMTTESAKASVLGSLMAEDKILQAMPSVVLALHLLCERRSAESPWKPYIDILPETYSTPLYFTREDFKYLKGSPALSECVSQYRNIARQYAYFYRLLQNNTIASNLPIKECFTFDDYRWAVSTVMTRQNQIPTPDGNKMTFALIPLWDMCNHCNGLITTDFNLDKNCSECYALRNYSEGEQIYIFYGARSNAELLVHNGFVYPENEHDRLAIKLGISKGDPLFSLKSDVLTRCGLLPSRTFYLHCGDCPVDSDLLVFLRIFSMDEESLKGKYSTANAAELREELGELEHTVTTDVEMKVWSYLETRSSLLLKAYDTTKQEDEDVLKKGQLTSGARLTVQLRMCEKLILEKSANYSKMKREELAQS